MSLFINRTLNWYLITGVILAAISAVVGGLLSLNPEHAEIRVILTTLAIVEASVMAIVFSVTVVALQLVSNRYSPRLTSLFVDDPLFKTTFILFIVAIGFDFLGAYLANVLDIQAMNAYVFAAFALAAIAVHALYRFIQMAVRRSSPDELISALLENELEPSVFISKIEDEDGSATHPAYPLFSIISRSMEIHDYEAVKRGITAFDTFLEDTMEYVVAKGGIDENAVLRYLRPIFADYFPAISIQAFEHEQYGFISTTAELSKRTGTTALTTGYGQLAVVIAKGVAEVFNEAPIGWEGERLREPATGALFDLTKTAASEADTGTYYSISHSLNFEMTVLLRREVDPDHTTLLFDYYAAYQTQIFHNLVERHADDLRDQDIRWLEPTVGNKFTLPDPAKPLRQLWKDRNSLTESMLYYRVNREQFPIAEGNISDGWNQMAEEAAEEGLDGLATLFCISMIEVPYCIFLIEDRIVGLWTHHLARLRMDYEHIVDEAFEYLKSGEQPEGNRIPTHINYQFPSESEESIFNRVFSQEEEGFDLSTWAEKYHEIVKERMKELE